MLQCLVKNEKITTKQAKKPQNPQHQNIVVPHLVISNGTASSTLPSGQDMNI